MKILIARSDREEYKEYQVEVKSGETTVMDILDDIYENLDHTLAYYKHSTCNQGICGRCAVKLNGRTVLACMEKVDSSQDTITIEPKNGKVVRDLVTE
ncbi:2Fe-2S iron-sulfur cluster-binding protein [Anaerocolumna jejuensis]|uniref:2Fe-2S iron-sulfur cluster-binding protein n=1 Tax=Anaerocolumna jejuensis TaxID=259063 RepID=UPI003F7CB872